MTSNRKLQKIRLVADRKHHGKLLHELFENIGLLDIEGLNSTSVIWKKKDFHYMHGRGHKDEGKYEKMPGPDIVVLYSMGDALHFLVVEAKGSELGKSYTHGGHQLDRAESYFRGFWKTEMVDRINLDLRRLDGTDVFLSLFLVTKEPLDPYKITPYKQNIYLGAIGSSEVHRSDIFLRVGY